MHVGEQLPTCYKLHDQVELFVCLEGKLHVDYKRRPHLCQDLALGHDVLELVLLDDVVLAEHFHGVVGVGALPLDKVHFAEAALAD